MKRYSVHSIFRTVQGEGFHIGRAAVFARFTACNYWDGRPETRAGQRASCARFCDTAFVHGEMLSLDDVVRQVGVLWNGGPRQHRLLVITGGEPMLQLDAALVRQLTIEGWDVAIETNGSVAIDPALRAHAWITLSPKLHREGAPMPLSQVECDELKVVLPGSTGDEPGWTDAQLEWLEDAVSASHRYVQPQDPPLSGLTEDTYLHPSSLFAPERDRMAPRAQEAYQAAVARCVAFVQGHARWRVGGQLHKLLGMP